MFVTTKSTQAATTFTSMTLSNTSKKVVFPSCYTQASNAVSLSSSPIVLSSSFIVDSYGLFVPVCIKQSVTCAT